MVECFTLFRLQALLAHAVCLLKAVPSEIGSFQVFKLNSVYLEGSEALLARTGAASRSQFSHALSLRYSCPVD